MSDAVAPDSYMPLRPPPSPMRPARIVEISRDDVSDMTLWFGPCGPHDVLDHVFDLAAWVDAAPGDTLLAASAAYCPQPPPGGTWQPVPAPVSIEGANAIVRLAPAGAYAAGTVLTLGCTALTAQGRVRAVAALVSIADSA